MDDNEKLVLALPKGRILDEVLPLVRLAGIERLGPGASRFSIFPRGSVILHTVGIFIFGHDSPLGGDRQRPGTRASTSDDESHG